MALRGMNVLGFWNDRLNEQPESDNDREDDDRRMQANALALRVRIIHGL